MAISINGITVAGNGIKGKDATINGVNALTIEGSDKVAATQQESVLILDVPNSVQVSGGGNLSMNESLGPGPYTIVFEEEEAGDLAATQVGYNNIATGMAADNVQDAVTELFTSVSNGKALIAGAITDKGVSTSTTDSFQQMADNIKSIDNSGTPAVIGTCTLYDLMNQPKSVPIYAGIPPLDALVIFETINDIEQTNGETAEYISWASLASGDYMFFRGVQDGDQFEEKVM